MFVQVINEAIKARNRQSVDKAPTGISGECSRMMLLVYVHGYVYV